MPPDVPQSSSTLTGLLHVGGLVAVVLVGYSAVWLLLLVHEVAHALVLLVVGGSVRAIEVGSGRHVWSRRLFGLRFVLRPYWSHGLMHGWITTPRAFRQRWIAVYLAGPVATTLVAALAVRLSLGIGWPDFAHGFWPWFASRSSWVTTLQAGLATIVAWMPYTLRIGRMRLPSDVLGALGMLRLPHEEIELAAAESAEQQRRERALEHFLAGDPAVAVAELERGDRWQADPLAALLFWARDGAGPALVVQERIETAFGIAIVTPPGNADTGVAAAWRRGMQEVLMINRLFLLVMAGRAGEPATAELGQRLSKFGNGPAALRTLGLFWLHAGDVARGMSLLVRAWHTEEPAWLRALCALYLAHGHALAGDPRRARRYLRKARWLHPQCPLLARISSLVAAAPRAAPVVGG